MREKLPKSQQTKHRIGSPLRVQGKVDLGATFLDGYRITPACAGKRVPQKWTLFATTDHPCVCREKTMALQFLAASIGSPLRVQGKDKVFATSPHKVRITPACAGKSADSAVLYRLIEDHPCVCREKV